MKHVEDFAMWAWGIKHRKAQYMHLPSLSAVAARALSDSDNISVIRQLAKLLAKSTEEAERPNLLRMKEFQLRKENEEKNDNLRL
eukprot:7799931-Ditylum_brightwellii.AAC.1